MRDALSLLDQGIAYGGAQGVTALAVRDMLGLSDRGEIVDLFERTMKGEIAAALDLMRALYRAGGDPADILIEVAEFCHFVTRLKIAPNAPDDAAIGEAERERGRGFAEKLTMGALTRAWQILLKGVEDVKDSPRPLASAEMALIRLAYATDLPTPEDALRKLAEVDRERAAPRPAAAAGRPPREPRGRCARSASARPPAAARRERARLGDEARALRGRRGARARQARHPARSGARARRPARPVRAGPHRSVACRGRLAGAGADAGEAPAGVDRRAVDGGAGSGRDRADPARDRRSSARPSRRAARRRIRWCARCSSGSRARASSRSGPRKPRRRRRRRPSDDDVGYADSEPAIDDDL